MSTYKLSDMTLFSRVDEGQVIISEHGIYRQVDLYKRGENLFAALKDGFVRLLHGEETTVSHIRWKAIEGIQYTNEYNGPKGDGYSHSFDPASQAESGEMKKTRNQKELF